MEETTLDFSDSSDPSLFKNVLLETYPDLTKEKGRYMSGGESKGRNVPQLLKNLSEDLSHLPEYSNYLSEISDKGRNNKVLRRFSALVSEKVGKRKISSTKERTKKRTEINSEKGLTLKIKKTKQEKIDGQMEVVEIEEIEKIFPGPYREVIEEEHEKETLTIEDEDGNVEDLSDHPLVKLYPDFVKKEIRKGGKLSESAMDRLHLLASWNIGETEKKWFSYKKCEEYLEKECIRIPEVSLKIRKTLDYLKERNSSYSSILRNIYDLFRPFFDKDCKLTKNEKLYIQTVFLTRLLECYISENGRKCRYCKKGLIDDMVEDLEEVSHMCISRNIPDRYLPFLFNDTDEHI
jgi:hypothetical protein